jgi:alpha-amylase
VKDLPEGGRPFFVHEVIDMGGEPIRAQEYFGVGKITEFRYGIKLAQCIRSYDFNCLSGIYDPVRLQAS